MDFKKANAPTSTVTYDRDKIDNSTDNIYKAISIISKEQFKLMRILEELISKLEEFATPSENLEEIFENKEQIEVSKFYERLPKAHAIAIDNWLSEKFISGNLKINSLNVISPGKNILLNKYLSLQVDFL